LWFKQQILDTTLRIVRIGGTIPFEEHLGTRSPNICYPTWQEKLISIPFNVSEAHSDISKNVAFVLINFGQVVIRLTPYKNTTNNKVLKANVTTTFETFK
jgi:hypothetical protein